MAKKKPKAKATSPSGLQLVLGDFFVTAIYVLASSLLGELAEWLILTFPQLNSVGGLSREQTEYGINIALLLLLIYLFTPVCQATGGAIVNPTSVFSIIAAGMEGKGGRVLNSLRMVAETAGAFAGSFATTKLVPSAYHSKFQSLSGSLKEDVQVEYGFACEAGLGFLMNFLFLYSLDTHNKQLGFWLPLLATAVWCYVGSYFTGPSMNPSIAASWNYHYQSHSTQEHVVVFWAGPFVGAALAGVFYRLITRAFTRAGARKAKAKRSTAATTQQSFAAAVAAAPAAPQAAQHKVPAAAQEDLKQKLRRRAKAANGVGPEAAHAKPAAAGNEDEGTSAGEEVTRTGNSREADVLVAEIKQQVEKAKRRKKKAAGGGAVEDGWQQVPARRRG